ncbi:hypothetical protein T440DRAFT_95315 [Plenodomus tracheiphilus IPT5]|uniref:Uncharacterized protein n=1 Tax=Plenodomus tracheiphilus IPT5 TaxID=1408161 RepID=A0A6A7BL26_9PLEO|nr:hypothetical protein T440DRAFT_95315 [Plenodomus tracheiphilus IPT5]
MAGHDTRPRVASSAHHEPIGSPLSTPQSEMRCLPPKSIGAHQLPHADQCRTDLASNLPITTATTKHAREPRVDDRMQADLPPATQSHDTPVVAEAVNVSDETETRMSCQPRRSKLHTCKPSWLLPVQRHCTTLSV